MISSTASLEILAGSLILQLSILLSEKASANTREPRDWASSACFGDLSKIISGAPRIIVPRLTISIDPHLRSLENGMIFSAEKSCVVLLVNLRIAVAV